jgi:hypothetical protein
MKCCIIILIMFIAGTTSAMAQRAYDETGRAWQACVGETIKSFMSGPVRLDIDEILEQRCGSLQLKESQQFTDYVRSLIGKPLSPEDAKALVDRNRVSPPIIRGQSVAIYLQVVSKRGR